MSDADPRAYGDLVQKRLRFIARQREAKRETVNVDFRGAKPLRRPSRVHLAQTPQIAFDGRPSFLYLIPQRTYTRQARRFTPNPHNRPIRPAGRGSGSKREGTHVGAARARSLRSHSSLPLLAPAKQTKCGNWYVRTFCGRLPQMR
jgi:hypothetical protein